MAAPVPAARPSLNDITPLEFAKAVCERAVMQAEHLLTELGETVHVRGVPSKLQSTRLWRRAFTWCEYARTGHAEHPELLDAFEPYDEVSTLVHDAAIARRKIAKGESVVTTELAAIANVSRIHIGNFVRSKLLRASVASGPGAKIQTRGGVREGYTFKAADARAFLRERGVAGF